MKDFDNGDLKEIIWQRFQGKNAIQKMTRTIDELEEEMDYDPTCEDWLDQQTYSGIPPKEWMNELQQDIFRNKR